MFSNANTNKLKAEKMMDMQFRHVIFTGRLNVKLCDSHSFGGGGILSGISNRVPRSIFRIGVGNFGSNVLYLCNEIKIKSLIDFVRMK